MSMSYSPPVSATWHEGELALHQHMGITKKMADIGHRAIRDHMIEQHRTFFAQLPLVVLGAVDDHDDVWATIRTGHPGFMRAKNDTTLQISLPLNSNDPAQNGIANGKPVGLLGIELETRRRNRMNGTITSFGDAGFNVSVQHSFGNCPQYIRLRDHYFVAENPGDENIRHTDHIDAFCQTLIKNADTFFVASYVERAVDARPATAQSTPNTRREVDVSHRGGNPGFVRIDNDGGLTIPDFAGNLFFNTLGNIVQTGQAGLLFADFETGTVVQMTGRAEILLNSPETTHFQGAERLWRFMPTKIIIRENALSLRWHPRDAGQSPNSLLTGSWDDAAQRARAAQMVNQWRPLEVVRLADESRTVRSFYLAPQKTTASNTAGLVPPHAGQFLPIRITMADGSTPVRTYTLSSAPTDTYYRISVARQNGVSRHLHDTMAIGDIVETRAPQGNFGLDALSNRPVVMMAGGIGITPMIAMMHHMLYEARRARRFQPCWLFYAARSKEDRAFDRELADLETASQGMFKIIRVLSDTDNALPKQDYDASGHIDMDLLQSRLPFDDYDFYLCGPSGFMQAMYDGLRGKNIADARIHAEAFGPASLTRMLDSSPQNAVSDDTPPATISDVPVEVTFAQSDKTAHWQPDKNQTVLDLAEAAGLRPQYGCRSGNCGSCAVRIVQGEVAYASQPSASCDADSALLCCAMPATGPDTKLVLDI
ncbi:pyridoxamine 5'-phosphate oxidase family protein [Thalassospira mesophila]|uniref:FAD-binding oxidoreductase n=1 Tax=Thalassospira mesophila TaxID=1293891 RepID=A0A1Y2KZK9_9PROT|nr:pyridoxamine 5'-phosphate oxidase family protein [Thalassospira mesophila]OSQ38298.1 FAD-binding oxidoreductase [Thalassospira mesophila]